MNEILNLRNDSAFPIDGRELHAKLGIETRYNDWFKRMCEYGFTEKADYTTVLKNEYRADGALMPQKSAHHSLTLSMAKEICMIQRTDLGRQIRRYLIDVEQAWNTPEQIMARALKIADNRIQALSGTVQALEAKVEADKPKVLFAESVSAAQTSILIGELAKLLKQNGVDMGQTRLFKWMRDNSYLMKNGTSTNLPTQRSMELGLFEIKETTINNPDGSVRLTRTPKVTGKGQVYFVNKFLQG